MTITERMLGIMKDKGLKAVDLATILGIGKSSISTWKARNTNPPSEYIVQICEFLNVNPIYLLTGEGEMYPSSNPPLDPRNLTGYQRLAAEAYLENLTMDQVALINSYEKLDSDGKEEIWALIKVKLKRISGLGSNFQTSKDEAG